MTSTQPLPRPQSFAKSANPLTQGEGLEAGLSYALLLCVYILAVMLIRHYLQPAKRDRSPPRSRRAPLPVFLSSSSSSSPSSSSPSPSHSPSPSPSPSRSSSASGSSSPSRSATPVSDEEPAANRRRSPRARRPRSCPDCRHNHV